MQKKQKTPKTQWKMQKSVGRNAETIACDAEAAAWDAEAAFPQTQVAVKCRKCRKRKKLI